MTSRLRQSFIDNLKSADWMDYSTRQSAMEKVRMRNVRIGGNTSLLESSSVLILLICDVVLF